MLLLPGCQSAAIKGWFVLRRLMLEEALRSSPRALQINAPIALPPCRGVSAFHTRSSCRFSLRAFLQDSIWDSMCSRLAKARELGTSLAFGDPWTCNSYCTQVGAVVQEFDHDSMCLMKHVHYATHPNNATLAHQLTLHSSSWTLPR